MHITQHALFIEGEGGGENGDSVAENGVLGLPDDTHPALADLLDEPVVRDHLVALSSHGPRVHVVGIAC